MDYRKTFIGVVLCLILIGCKQPETSQVLTRSTPEAEGVSSGGILEFMEQADKSEHEFHSFMFLRHGKVIAEGWWDPYNKDLVHTMYSASKSFTSTAIGFAVTEKLITVDDKIVSFFPEDLPDTVNPYLAEMTIKDLITMSTGQDPEPTWSAAVTDNWIKVFLAAPISDEPGSTFRYNSLATYMLSAIVQKVTGEKVIDYLTPRLFEPLDITGIDWEEDPMGINTGGWGLRIKTEDMAKFGQLYLQKGNWNGVQIIPPEWVDEATTMHILQAPDLPQSTRDSSDWLQGYGYQFWRCRHNAYRGDGAFGQFIIIMPEKDAVIAITSEAPDMQGEINLVWEYLLPSIHDDELPANETAVTALNKKLSSLALLPPEKTENPSVAANISGKTFEMSQNDRQIKSISFGFTDNTCHMTMFTETASYEFDFGSGTWQTGETTKHGPNLVSGAKASLTGLPPFKVTGSYTWADEENLELVLRYIESPHTETMVCHFTQDSVTVDIKSSLNTWYKEPVLKGVLKAAD